jgi:NADH-quinone oxidoreductase subunit D
MNYLSPICNNIGLACAVEHMMGIEVTPRCAAIRIVLYELGRIADHIIGVGLQAMDLGAFSIMLWSFIEREKLYDIFENVTGARLTTSYTRVGGLSGTCPTTSRPQVRSFMKADTRPSARWRACSTATRSSGTGDRHQRASRARDADGLGLTGPLLRASGVPYDVRKHHPYLGYDKLRLQDDHLTLENRYGRGRVGAVPGPGRGDVRVAADHRPGVVRHARGPVNVDDPEIIIPHKTRRTTRRAGWKG